MFFHVFFSIVSLLLYVVQFVSSIVSLFYHVFVAVYLIFGVCFSTVLLTIITSITFFNLTAQRGFSAISLFRERERRKRETKGSNSATLLQSGHASVNKHRHPSLSH